MFRSKPTVGSVCGGICRALSFPHERHPETLSYPIYRKKRDMFRNKPTVGSVCGGICRTFLYITYVTTFQQKRIP